MSTLTNLLRLLSPRERKQAILLLPLLTLSALLEVAGVASIVPFLTVVADPNAINDNAGLARIFSLGNFTDHRSFLIALGMAMLFLIVGSNVLTAFSTWTLLRFSWMRNHSIGVRLLAFYLRQPYDFFLERHSAELGKNLLVEVQQVVSGTVVPLMQMVAKSLAALGVLLLLLYIDPILATLTTLVLGGAYGVLFLSIRKHQRHLGELRLVANSERFEVLSDGFGGIKELMLLGRTNHVVTRFSGPSHAFASATAMNAVIGQLPRFAFESLAFGGIVLMVVYFLGSNRDFQSVVPVLGLYGFAAYRLMPSLQMIFLSMTTIRFNTAALEKLLEEVPEASHSFSEPRLPVSSPLPLSQGIRFSDVGFRYPRAKSELFVSLNFYLQAGQSVAFVGPTGSGKSTIADLILGLLDPTEGTIEVDGLALRGDVLRRWQANLGYVPQSIFLANQTIARNIAFGLPTDEVDLQAVEKAAKTAHIHSFIKNELPEGYETVTGERGVRLSGGQRQRIGIARALYGNPGILIFDEATSALDSVTEESIVRATQELSKDRTVITIAHRFSTVRHCDCIFLLDNGRLLASGPYDYLISTSKAFRDLASSSSG